jgi:hypothetical protein
MCTGAELTFEKMGRGAPPPSPSAENQFPNDAKRTEIGAQIGLTSKQVNTWLSHRRQKAKKAEKKAAEAAAALADVANAAKAAAAPIATPVASPTPAAPTTAAAATPVASAAATAAAASTATTPAATPASTSAAKTPTIVDPSPPPLPIFVPGTPPRGGNPTPPTRIRTAPFGW